MKGGRHWREDECSARFTEWRLYIMHDVDFVVWTMEYAVWLQNTIEADFYMYYWVRSHAFAAYGMP